MIIKVVNKIKQMITRLLIKINYGKQISIGKKFSFRRGISIQLGKNAKVKIGNNVFMNNYCSINSLDYIEIGDDCIFGEGVKLYDHNHVFNENRLIRESGFKTSKITIGNNCWIGSDVIILKNAKIGNNCVIGAGCIINEKIDDNSIVKMDRNINCIKINVGDEKDEC